MKKSMLESLGINAVELLLDKDKKEISNSFKDVILKHIESEEFGKLVKSALNKIDLSSQVEWMCDDISVDEIGKVIEKKFLKVAERIKL